MEHAKIVEILSSFKSSFGLRNSGLVGEFLFGNHVKLVEILSPFNRSFVLPDLGLVGEFRFPIPLFTCGSTFEGTTTHGLESDFDNVYLLEFLPVITRMLDAQQYRYCFLVVQDPHTPAGYAKLQVVERSVPLFVQHLFCRFNDTCINWDAKDRLVVRSDVKLLLYLGVTEYHGPAATIEDSHFRRSVDNVTAVMCKTWPDCADEWLTRQRLHNWPSQEQIEKCKTLGCFFVQAGHPDSSEKHFEWRISFSLQERLLVTDFNSVQLKCYVLLKMIKKEKVHATLGEKSLTSYHFKTCMLYMIESTPAEFWVEDNLPACLYNILCKMLRWVETGECPNYFIPKENMFEGRLTNQQQGKLSNLLRNLLSVDFKFLLDIKCDMLGERLQEGLASGGFTYISVYPQTSHMIMLEGIPGVFILEGIQARNHIFRLCEDKHTQVCFWRLYKLKLSLEGSEMVTGPEHIRKALSLIVSNIDIVLMSILIVLAKRLSKSTRFTFTLLSEKWDAPNFDPYRFDLKLKQASLLHMMGHNELSLEILDALVDQIRHHLSLCCCRNVHGEIVNCVKKILLKLQVSNRSLNAAMDSGLSVPCLVFLPAEGDLTPLALCYEMYRSIGSPPEGKENWHDWAVVDGKVLLYFLLYLNHRQHGMEEQAAVDMDNILRLIQTDQFLGHKETAYNLLGWTYMERRLVAKAMECFKKSLAIKSTHNAAFLLLAFEICVRINGTEAFYSEKS